MKKLFMVLSLTLFALLASAGKIAIIYSPRGGGGVSEQAAEFKGYETEIFPKLKLIN